MAKNSKKKSSDQIHESLSLREFIQAVRDDLVEAEEERIESGHDPLFKVDSLEIEASIVVTDKVEGGGGLKIQVLSFGASRGRENEAAHKINLKLSAVDSGSFSTGKISARDLGDLVDRSSDESGDDSKPTFGLHPAEDQEGKDVKGGIIFFEEDDE